jgi:lipopolysaccharide biosynthesis glycosyltransferase
MEQQKYLHLALAFDQNFVTPFYVNITSIFENNKGISFFLHIIASGVSSEEKKKIKEYAIRNQTAVQFYVLDSSLVESFPRYSPHFTAAAYYRLFFPFVIPPTVTKFIYLDVDIVINGSLSDLYGVNIGDFPVAASPDPGIKSRPELGIINEGEYFNSGVLLINTEQWKKQRITEKAIQYMTDYPERILFVDQDALNAILVCNWFKISNQFNLQSGDVPNAPKKELISFLQDKIVIHYTSSNKPWKLLCTHPLRYLYNFYLSKSPKALTQQHSGLKLIKVAVTSFVINGVINFYLSNPTVLKTWRKLRS